MLSSIFSIRIWELVQANAQFDIAKQAFAGFSNADNILAFLQTPEFQLLAVAVIGTSILTLALHVWAWVKMMLDKEDDTAIQVTSKGVHTSPSQQYIPKALLWQSSRIGFEPKYGLIDHKSEKPETNRGKSTPTRGGDLP